jgi:hypothetical protein
MRERPQRSLKMGKNITLYRGQKAVYDIEAFVPALLRDDIVQKIEMYIKNETGVSDLEPYKAALSDFRFSVWPNDLYKQLADENHLYYFFLSLVNIGLKVRNNPVFNDSQSFATHFRPTLDLLLITKDNAAVLTSPRSVSTHINHLLHMDSIFDGERLGDYSLFQHLNFIFPKQFPTLLLDWTSDIETAAFFSKDGSGNLGTVVSIEFPNQLYSCQCDFIGTTSDLQHQSTFINTVGYICDNYDCGCENRSVNMTNGRAFNFQVHKFHSTFQQSLTTLQKATCLYWPYNQGSLEELNPELKAALRFKKLSAEELQEERSKSREMAMGG